MLYKLENGRLLTPTDEAWINGRRFGNMRHKDDYWRGEGYKPMTGEPMPDDGGRYRPIYEDTGESILRTWERMPDPVVNISKVALLEALGEIGLRDAMLAAIESDADTKLFFDQSVVVEWNDPRVQAMIGFLKSVGLTDEQETAIYHGCRSPVMFRDGQ